MGAVNIVKFKSEPGRTFFAPEFDYTIFETETEQVDFKELAKLLLSKEKEVLSLPAEEGSDTTLRDLLSTYETEMQINNAVVAQAEADAAKSGGATPSMDEPEWLADKDDENVLPF